MTSHSAHTAKTSSATAPTLELRENATVRSADNNDLGKVERLVVDPSKRQITHLVVSKGWFFPEERVVPVEIIASANEDQIILDEAVEPEDLPRFELVHYVSLEDDRAASQYPGSASAPLVWSYPAFAAPIAGTPMYPMYSSNRVASVERNVPEGSRVVQVGSSVVASDGTDVGKVASVDTDDAGRFVSIGVDPGWFKSEQIIPDHFIDQVEQDQVTLAVPSATLEQLSSG